MELYGWLPSVCMMILIWECLKCNLCGYGKRKCFNWASMRIVDPHREGVVLVTNTRNNVFHFGRILPLCSCFIQLYIIIL